MVASPDENIFSNVEFQEANPFADPSMQDENPFAGSDMQDTVEQKTVSPTNPMGLPEIIDNTPTDTLGSRLQEKASNTWEYIKNKFANADADQSLLEKIAGINGEPNWWDYFKEVPSDVALSASVGLGQTVGALEDITGTALGKAFKAITPQGAQDYVYDRFLDFSTTKAGEAGLKALGMGIEKYNEWADKNPDAAMELGSMLNLMGGSFAADLATKAGRRPLKEMLKAGSDIIYDLGKISPQHVRSKIKGVTDKYFLKAVNPPKGMGTSDTAIKQLKESAANSVYDIVENKGSFTLTDGFDNIVDNRLPETLHQFNEAISQGKQRVFSQYNEIAQVAGDKGLMVDLTDLYLDKIDEAGDLIEAPLNQIANSVGLQAMDKDTVDRAMELIDIFENRLDAGMMPIAEAQKLVTAANNLKSKVPGLDNQVADFVREKMNEAVDSLADARYSNLKKTYGQYKAIEESVSKQAFAEMKKGSGLFDLGTNIFSLGEIAKGLAGGGTRNIAKGVTEKAVQKIYQKLNKPDRKIKKMFQEADNAYKRMAEVPIQEADNLYAKTINKNIDNEIKKLEGQKQGQITEGAMRMGGPAPEPPPDVIPLPSRLSEFKNLKSMGKDESGMYRWTDDLSKTSFKTTTSNPAEIRKALQRTRKAAKNVEDISKIKNLTSQGEVNGKFQWRDDIYGGNFQTTSNDPEVVKKALEAKRKEFKDAGNKTLKEQGIKATEEKPLDQKEWLADLRKMIDEEKAKRNK